MDLRTYEEKVISVCFAASPAETDFAALGPAGRWRLYRQMVRSRLREMLTSGLPRTTKHLGGAFAPLVDRWFAEAPPTTRYIREVVPAFVPFALREWAAAPPHAWLPDLARFEMTRWVTTYVAPSTPVFGEFDFLRPVQLNPTLARLDLGFAVHEDRETYAAEPTQLALYRKPDRTSVSTFVLRPFSAALLDAWADPTVSAKDGAARVATERAMQVDASFVDLLGTAAADLLEAGIVRGSRTQDPATP